MSEISLEKFTLELASSAPTPGGGGASALAGALAASLSGMVCALTRGKRRYAAFEEDIKRLGAEAEECRSSLLALVDADAEAFAPLAEAYRIPKDDPARDRLMEPALVAACEPPLAIMRLCGRVIGLCAELAEKGSAMAISDVGVSAALARAALMGASLNVFINAGSMRDREAAAELQSEAEKLIELNAPEAERVFRNVRERLGS